MNKKNLTNDRLFLPLMVMGGIVGLWNGLNTVIYLLDHPNAMVLSVGFTVFLYPLVLTLAGGAGAYIGCSGRFKSPILWTGIAGGTVVGLVLALFTPEVTSALIVTLAVGFCFLGLGIGLFTDILVTDAKRRS